MKGNVLLVGESWVAVTTHYKGFDHFVSGGFDTRVRAKAKKGTKILATMGGDPLLVIGEHMDGRAVAWTSDIGPHWCPKEFAEWEGYSELWRRRITWASGE